MIYDNPFIKNESKTGTLIRIRELTSLWSCEKIEQLKGDLSRLLSPFNAPEYFSINIRSYDKPVPVPVRPAEFINKPKYKIYGSVDKHGDTNWSYTFHDVKKIV